jgi:hypothetical protein
MATKSHAKPKRTTRGTIQRAAVRRAAPMPSGPSTLDRATRTVRAVIATNEPVMVYDSERDEWIAEVLIPSGMVEPTKMALRLDHMRGQSRDRIGRVFGFSIRPNEVEATLQFSAAADAMEIFDRVADGAVDAVSIGATYSMRDTIDLEPGQSKTVDGIKYTAMDVVKRLALKWAPDETSVVDQGADHRAVFRSARANSKPRNGSVNTGAKKPIRTRFCDTVNSGAIQRAGNAPESISTELPAMPNTRQPKRQKSTRANDRTRDRIKPDSATTRRTKPVTTRRTAAHVDGDADTVAHDDGDGADDDGDTEGDYGGNDEAGETRRSKTKPQPSTEVKRVADELRVLLARADAATTATNPAATPDQFAEGQRAERARVAQINQLGEGLPELAAEAIEKGWTVDQFSRRALAEHNARSTQSRTRQQGNGIDRAPAGHVSRGASVQALGAALMMANGIDIESDTFTDPRAQMFLERSGFGWVGRMAAEVGNSARHDDTLEQGRRLMRSSPVRICERMMELTDRRRSSEDDEQMVSRAFSNPYMPRVFGSIITVGFIQGFIEYPDATDMMADEADWPDFRMNQPIGLNGTQGLRLHTRRTEAKDIDISEFGESYAVRRYTGKFSLDEMDIIDGTLGLTEAVPLQMGQLARELRPDLFVSVLQSNPTLASDSVTLFHASRGNALTGRAWSLDNLAAAETAMAAQTIATKSGKTKTRNLQAGYVFVPRALRPAAKRDVTSTVIVSGNTTDRGANNWAAGDYQVRSDARLDVGVIDPRTEPGTMTTGSASRWYVFEQSGKKFLQFGFRRGTGRVPQMRASVKQVSGQWGYDWDIAYDLGIGILSPQAAVRCDA